MSHHRRDDGGLATCRMHFLTESPARTLRAVRGLVAHEDATMGPMSTGSCHLTSRFGYASRSPYGPYQCGAPSP